MARRNDGGKGNKNGGVKMSGVRLAGSSPTKCITKGLQKVSLVSSTPGALTSPGGERKCPDDQDEQAREETD